MILAAGKGERMRPLTDTAPKPLLKVQDKELIVWHIEKLAKSGFSEIIINIAHLGFMIPQALGDGSRWGVKLIYSDEQICGGLESAGGIIKALPHLSETFLVVNGDIWCDAEFNPSFTLGDNDTAHLVLVANPAHNPNGDFGFSNGRAVEDGEKLTFSGIGYYKKEFFTGYEVDVLKLAPLLRQAIHEGEVSAELHSGEWVDVGTPQRLEELNLAVL